MAKIYSSILIISDTQAPYHHVDTIDFLQAVKETINPDLVVHIGDEVDLHSISFHTKNPDLHSPRHELELSRLFCKELQELFPTMTLLESNHGSLLYRKAIEHGIPSEMVKSYNDVLKVKRGWKWVPDLMVETASGTVYFDHGQKETALRMRNRYGISVVQGHRHQEAYVDWRKSPFGDRFAMQVGCLIDDESYAFSYNKKDMNRPMLACGVITGGDPQLVRMNLDKRKRWDRKLSL
jgi:hypothetical protein